MRQPGAHQEHVHLFMRRYHDTEDHFPPLGRRRPVRLLLGLVLALTARAALAQLSGSLAVLSDYRFRGISLSDGQASAQLTLNYDSETGWYGGAMAARARLEDSGTAQLIAYGGYAQRLPGGMGWEAGAAQNSFSRFGAANYAEAYVGFSGERVNARLYYAPRYFGRAVRSLYADANGFLRLGERVRLIGHAGLQHMLRGDDPPGFSSGHRCDFRLGIGAHAGAVDVQLARVSRAAQQYAHYRSYPGYPAYPLATAAQRRAFVLSAAYSF